MLILITVVLLFVTSLALLILSVLRRPFRFAWLTAVGAAFLAWLSVILWRALLPLSLHLGSWAPADLLPAAPMLMADQFSWLYALSLVTLALATVLTAPVRADFPRTSTLSVILAVCGLGLLAVTAGNPLSLALLWAALDLTELITILSSADGRAASQRVVTTFAVNAVAIILLMLAQVTSSPINKPVDFSGISPAAGLLLLAAAGLRLGILPVHLPYASETSLRRGVGTSVRLVSAAASLVLLSRVPATSIPSLLALLILVITALAALYAGWMWLRAPDELVGRPFWIMGLAALAVFSAMRGNPVGATAWGVALILAGAALFISSIQNAWLNRALLAGAWTVSALPFSLTATGWIGAGGALDLALPVFIAAQALLAAGFVRHALRPSTRTPLESQPAWARSVYPAGLALLIVVQAALGFAGWDGSLQIGVWVACVAAAVLTVGILWAVPRFRVLNPVPAHWLQPLATSRIERLFRNLRGFYDWLESISQTVSGVLEGDAGLMWTLLFLVLFVVMIVQRNP